MIKIRMTYETVTPESAEDGDFADHGFAQPGGWHFSIADDAFHEREKRDGREKALRDMTPEPMEFESVEDAIDELERYGSFEASTHPLPRLTDGYLRHCWLTQCDSDENYETGESLRYSFHLESGTNEEWLAILQHFAR